MGSQLAGFSIDRLGLAGFPAEPQGSAKFPLLAMVHRPPPFVPANELDPTNWLGAAFPTFCETVCLGSHGKTDASENG